MSATTVNQDLSSVTVSDDGTMECALPNYNPETLVPFGSEADVLAYAATIEGRQYFWVPKISDEEKATIAAAAAAEQNVARAKQELVTSDWSDLPSVRNAEMTPHLVNAAAFDAYRLALRSIIIGRPAAVAEWPSRPEAQWS